MQIAAALSGKKSGTLDDLKIPFKMVDAKGETIVDELTPEQLEAYSQMAIARWIRRTSKPGDL